jgi:ABC-2 type transport system ATP-binding protein
MSALAIDLQKVTKRLPGFVLDDLSLQLEPGQVMGLVGPNGAGKSTTLRVLMGMSRHDAGDVRVLGFPIPEQQARAKQDIGFVSHDMSLFGSATLGWHMQFVQSVYASWDAAYATTLARRFSLRTETRMAALSTGERMLAMLLLVLARRPKLLILDEPTAGLDPVARHVLLAELMDVLRDESRAILFSSHNTLDIEQISDRITFMDRGRIIASENKEGYLDRWRRLHLDVAAATRFDVVPGTTDIVQQGRSAVMTTSAFTPALEAQIRASGITVHDVQRMSLEEIFVATVFQIRKERGE